MITLLGQSKSILGLTDFFFFKKISKAQKKNGGQCLHRKNQDVDFCEKVYFECFL